MPVDQVKKEKLGQILVQSGLVSPIDIDHALQAQQVFGGTLGTNLVEMGTIDDDVLAFFLSKQMGIEKITSLELENIAPELLAIFPAKAAQQLNIIALGKKDQSLTVAMIDPSDTRIVHKIEENTGFILHPKVAPEFKLHMALKKHYGIPLSPRISRLLHHQQLKSSEATTPFKKHLDQHMTPIKAVESFFNNIGSIEKVPVVEPIEDIKRYQLTPELLFTFQQIDGVSSIQDIIQLSVFSKLDTLRALVYFYEHDLIRFEDPS